MFYMVRAEVGYKIRSAKKWKELGRNQNQQKATGRPDKNINELAEERAKREEEDPIPDRDLW